MPTNEFISGGMRGNYQRRMLEIRGAFEAGGASGAETIAGRAAAVDEVVKELWRQVVERDSRLGVGVALLAVGGPVAKRKIDWLAGYQQPCSPAL